MNLRYNSSGPSCRAIGAPSTMSHPHPDQTRWFTTEVQPHGSALKSYLRGAFPSVRDVDDVVQESYLRIWRARFDQQIHFSKSFLFQVARRIAIDWLRRQEASPVAFVSNDLLLPVHDEARGAAETASVRDDVECLMRALETMPPRLREVVLLRKVDGLSQKEIAARLNLSELTVQSHVVRGLRRLEETFRQRSG